MRETLRDREDREREEEEEEEEETERVVNEHLLIVREMEEDDEEEEEDDDARIKVEYGGGISLTNTTSIPSILSSPSPTHSTPLFSILSVCPVSPLMSMFTVCSFCLSHPVDDECDDEDVSAMSVNVNKSERFTSPAITIPPVDVSIVQLGVCLCSGKRKKYNERL